MVNAVKRKKPIKLGLTGFLRGAPKEIRTPNLLIRSQMLYPVELWVRVYGQKRTRTTVKFTLLF
jgi:hypothetical protein